MNMKSQAIANRINSDKFIRSTGGKTFFADVSQLEHEKHDAFDQVWHDEGTKGFVLVSQWTGKEVPFELYHTEREADGDVRAWLFKPHQHAVNLDGRLKGVTTIIFNT
jgi:hypothetical protein